MQSGAQAPEARKDDMLEISVDDCSCGDVLALDVFDSNNRRLLCANTVVNEYIKLRLKRSGTERVRIYNASGGGEAAGSSWSYARQIREAYTRLTAGGSLFCEKPPGIYRLLLEQEGSGQISLIDRFLSRLEHADPYTYSHSLKVAFYSWYTARLLDLPEINRALALKCGLLHDVGKIRIPDSVLKKPGPLTLQEYSCMKNHTILGYRMLLDTPEVGTQAREAALLHHERMDGSGYPLQIVPNSLYARIVAITDVYDAITSDRVYKKGESPFHAFEFFLSEGRALFDWNILEPFITNICTVLIGSFVPLASGETAEIVYISPENPLRPILRINTRYTHASADKKSRFLKPLSAALPLEALVQQRDAAAIF